MSISGGAPVPVGYPIESTSSGRDPRLSGAKEQPREPTDYPHVRHRNPRLSPPPRRLSQAHLHTLDSQLSSRDKDVLATVRRFRLTTAAQLQRLHFRGHASEDTAQRICRRVLKRLLDHGLVRRLERRIGGLHAGSAGHIHAATPLGHRLLEIGTGEATRKRWREPSAGFVTHTLAIAELGSMAVKLALDEGQELLRLETEPDVWRPFYDGTAQQTLKPDLALSLADEATERSWFIEVDLDTESRNVISRKCQLYTSYWRTGIEQGAHGVFPRVLWVAPDAQRANSIASTFERRGIEPRLFQATTADQAALLLADLHHSNK